VIRQVGASDTHALRQHVLRPHQTLADMVYPGDDDPTTGHFAAIDDDGDDDTVIGIVTVSRQPPPTPVGEHRPAGDWWRLRGMATAEGHRGQGVGSALMAAAVAHVAAQGGKGLWCNARLPALAFYQRAGFVTVGEPWDEPDIGPHVVMWRAVP
jgi:GNAT superfamily N-acetyltransferase